MSVRLNRGLPRLLLLDLPPLLPVSLLLDGQPVEEALVAGRLVAGTLFTIH